LLHPGVAAAEGDPTADASRERSRAAFMRGVSDAHLGHYTAARDEFVEAYKLFAHPSILLNLGIARWHTGEYIQAEKDLARFLSDDGGASDEDIANARAGLSAVRQHLGTLHVRVAPEGARVTLDGQPVALTPGAFADVRAVVGPTELRAEAEGYEPLHRSLLVAHDPPETLDLALTPARGAGGPVAALLPDDRTRKTVLYAAFGVAAVSAVAWAACGVRALMLAGEYDSPSSSEYQSPGVRSSGVAFRTAADVFFGTALAAGGVGVYLLVFPGQPRGSRAPLGLALGPGSLRLEGRF
jgi:hypothetical protein